MILALVLMSISITIDGLCFNFTTTFQKFSAQPLTWMSDDNVQNLTFVYSLLSVPTQPQECGVCGPAVHHEEEDGAAEGRAGADGAAPRRKRFWGFLGRRELTFRKPFCHLGKNSKPVKTQEVCPSELTLTTRHQAKGPTPAVFCSFWPPKVKRVPSLLNARGGHLTQNGLRIQNCSVALECGEGRPSKRHFHKGPHKGGQCVCV